MRKLFPALLFIVSAFTLSTAQISPNIGLNLPPFGTPGGTGSASWNKQYEANWLALDNYMSGHLPIPALNITGNLSVGGTATMGNVVVLGICTNCGSGGPGPVTNFSAGNLSPLFTTTVATSTTTPALSFSLSNAAPNSVLAGPASGGAGAPSYQTAPTISAANMTNFPTFNQNTTGNAGGLSGVPNITVGTVSGTVLNASTGFQVGGAAALGHYLRGNGTNYIDNTIQAGDVPTLNQSTTGNAATATTLSGCSGLAASGDVCIYSGSTWARLAGNASGTKYLQETSSGVGSWTTPAGTLPAGTQCNPLINMSGTTYATSFLYCDASQFSGATMDVPMAAAVAVLIAAGGGVLDVRAFNGTQTWALNPFNALVGSGYLNSETPIYVLLCNVTINTKRTVTLTTGVHLIGCGRTSVTIQAAGSGFPVTDTAGVVTSTSAASGTPYTSTWAGTGTNWTSAQQESIIGICTTTSSTGAACSTNTGNINYGQIKTVSSTTGLTIYCNNANNCTSNSTGPFNYVIFSPVILMGDMSGSSGANPNFDVEVRGIHIGTQGQLGAIPLAVYNCQQQCFAEDFTLSPSDSQGLDIESSQAQESGPFDNFWVVASDCTGTTKNPVGIMNRTNGSSTIASVRDFSVALSGCYTTGNGATYPIAIDAQTHIGPGIHLLLGNTGNTTTVGVSVAATTPIVCPVFCIVGPGKSDGAIIEDVNAAGNAGLAAVRVGTNNSPTNIKIIGIKAATGSTGFTNTFMDDNAGCIIPRPTSGTLEATLNEYDLDAVSFPHSTSRVPGCGNLYSAATVPLTGAMACSTAFKGESTVVTDAVSPTYNGTYTSGGASTMAVICNGSNWVTY